MSVIIATNRGGPFLADALCSVESQTYPNVETVLVDDGTHTPEEVAATAAAFPSVRLIRQANAGASVARNAGVAHTTGQFIVFLDDDDRWHTERISSQVAALAADSSAVASYCGMRTIDESGDEILPGDQRQAQDIHAIFRREAGIILPNLMMRRDTFLRVGGFHPGFRQAEDLDLVLKVALEGSFSFVPRTLVDYRYHARNVTRSHRELARSIDAVLRLHRWAAQERGREDLMKDLDFSLAANGRFAMWTVSRFAREEVRQGRYGPAVRESLWALGFAPKAPLSWLARRIDRVRVGLPRTPTNEDTNGRAGTGGERRSDLGVPATE